MTITVSLKSNMASIGRTLALWFDSYSNVQDKQEDDRRIDWLRATPFIFMHIACLAVFFVGWSPIAIVVAVLAYFTRMFGITAFYHRYFSHRAFRTSRVVQFLGALLGAAAVQRGPLWWAAHHRLHHATSDKETDQHSPKAHGMLWSHIGWFLSRGNFSTREELVKDYAKYPELRLIDRFDVLVPLLFAAFLYLLGSALEIAMPSLQTTGPQMLVWGFFISTVLLYHGTFTINSLAHKLGRRVLPTRDDSRNNFWLALITMGEGWHNNHHYYPGSARQGFLWWELDLCFYGLVIMEKCGLVWDLRPVPQRVYRLRGKA